MSEIIIPCTSKPSQYGQVVVNPDGSDIGLSGVLSQIEAQADSDMDFTYLDAGGADERVSTIVYSSVTLGLSVTQTFTYAGSSPNYRIDSITLS